VLLHVPTVVLLMMVVTVMMMRMTVWVVALEVVPHHLLIPTVVGVTVLFKPTEIQAGPPSIARQAQGSKKPHWRRVFTTTDSSAVPVHKQRCRFVAF
jgi:hypothetical protein